MIDDREIWACAMQVIRQHGEDARDHAARRAGELLDQEDLAGQRVWLRILARIEDLQLTTATGSTH